jgi:hypothetical protein
MISNSFGLLQINNSHLQVPKDYFKCYNKHVFSKELVLRFLSHPLYKPFIILNMDKIVGINIHFNIMAHNTFHNLWVTINVCCIIIHNNKKP